MGYKGYSNKEQLFIYNLFLPKVKQRLIDWRLIPQHVEPNEYDY